jgi:tetratricopeptide (TPR) repeat protein
VSVLEELEEELGAARQAGQSDLVANLLVTKAPLLIKKGDHDAAAECYLEALTICETLNNPAGQARVLLRLGDLLLMEGETDLAVKRFEQAIRIGGEVSDESPAIWGGAFERMSQVAEEAGDLETALKWAVKLERLCLEGKDQVGLTLSVQRLARLLARTDQVQDALSQYGRLFMLAEAAGDGRLQALALAATGELQARAGDMEAARDYLNLARRAYSDMGSHDLAQAVADQLARLA